MFNILLQQLKLQPESAILLIKRAPQVKQNAPLVHINPHLDKPLALHLVLDIMFLPPAKQTKQYVMEALINQILVKETVWTQMQVIMSRIRVQQTKLSAQMEHSNQSLGNGRVIMPNRGTLLQQWALLHKLLVPWENINLPVDRQVA